MNASNQDLSLAARTIRGGVWTVLGQGADTLIRLVSSIIMTRLLFPEAFGLVTASASIMVGLSLLTDVGIRTSIIRSDHGNTDLFLRSAWTLQLARGILIWILLLLMCWLLGLEAIRSRFPAESVFAAPQFPIITAALGLSLVIGGLESTNIFLALRTISLRPLIILDFVSRIVSLPVMILIGWISGSVWSIVLGSLLSSITRLALSHWLVPGPRMALSWHRSHMLEMIRFGRWITVSSWATFVGGQSDRMIGGILLSGADLGLYSIAKGLMDAVTALFDKLNSSLAVPVLGEVIRKDVRQLKERYYRFRLPFDMVAPLIGGAIAVSGPLIVSILFDRRYDDVGIMLQILAVGLLFYPATLIAHAFPLTNEPKIAAIASIIQAISLITFLLGGIYFWGVYGVAFGVALHKVVPSLFILLISFRRGWVRFLLELRVVPSFILGAALGVLLCTTINALRAHFG